jgi:L-seryl-tRNA(Ser) seleniumtransferase
MAPGTDRFGNLIDPAVAYARGPILAGEVEETLRQRHGYALVREWFRRGGHAAVYNLTGLIRGFPFAPGDEDWLRSYMHFGAHADGQLEAVALKILGGEPEEHDGFLATRVSAGILAIMLALVEADDLVVSLVPTDRSHPSIRQAVELARGRFVEVIGLPAFEAALTGARPRLVVISTIAPSKHHLAAADTLRAIELARRAGALVMLDDAHMAARIAYYGEDPGLKLGHPDIVVWSLDKHCGGPRSGFVAGLRTLVPKIRARAFALGLEAQPAQYVAGLRALERWDPEPIRAAGEMAKRLFPVLQKDAGDRAYMAGPGLAITGDDLQEMALARAAVNPAIVPVETVAVASFAMAERDGIITIPVSGMPGAACVFRLMMFPDGTRLGDERLIASWRHAFDVLAELVGDREKSRRLVLGA